MKTYLYTLVLIFIPLLLSGQNTPRGISYQAVARDVTGDELENANISVKLSVLSGAIDGPAEWVETHNVTTNRFGLFELVIGQGSHFGGTAESFGKVQWGNGPHFLKVEIDFGTGYRFLGTNQFFAVPYALYAENAGNAEDTRDDQQLSYDPETQLLTLENGGTIDLSTLIQNVDNDNTNELITRFELDGDSLSITDAGGTRTVNLSKYTAVGKDAQDLSLTGNILSVTNDDTPVDLSGFLDNTDNQELIYNSEYGYLSIEGSQQEPINIKNIINQYDKVKDADADSTNEIQYLSYDGQNLRLSKGNAIPLSVNDADADPENEIQDLRYQNHKIWVTKNEDSTIVDLNPYLKDDQQLNIENNTLYLTGDNPSQVPLDGDPFNEIQDLTLSKDTLTITKNNNATKIGLSKYLDNTDAQELELNGNELTLTGDNPTTVNIDADPSNEIQNLSYDNSTYDLTLDGGGNGVNISPVKIAFRAKRDKDFTTVVQPGDSLELEFDSTLLNMGDDFEDNKLTVPINGAGLYQFTIRYKYTDDNSYIEILKNGSRLEELEKDNSYSLLIELEANDEISLCLYSDSGPTSPEKGEFSGFRVY